ncbi:MAG: hypothetical protein R3Y53_04145 [Bacillota bacterium]
MAKNSRANAVIFGFDFQVNAAIVLMLEHIEDLKSLRLEGNYEDIEIELENNKYILAQAKSVEKASSDFRNVKKNLKKSLNTLSNGAKKIDVQSLIMITNSPNPLNDASTSNIFIGEAHRDFDSLPPSAKQIINEYVSEISQPLDLNKFMIQVLPFETDNDLERYKIVRKCIDDFIGNLSLSIPGLGNKLMNLWHEDIFINGTKRDAEIKLKKSDIIWPVMVIATDVDRCDEAIFNRFDPSAYDEIIHQYKAIIDSRCEKCEFFTKVLSDYTIYDCNKNQSEKPIMFALEKWSSYVSEFQIETIEDEILKGLIQIILYTIVRNRITIDRIKKGVNL